MGLFNVCVKLGLLIVLILVLLLDFYDLSFWFGFDLLYLLHLEVKVGFVYGCFGIVGFRVRLSCAGMN